MPLPRSARRTTSSSERETATSSERATRCSRATSPRPRRSAAAPPARRPARIPRVVLLAQRPRQPVGLAARARASRDRRRRPSTWPSGPLAAEHAVEITTTSSTLWATSDSRWLDTSTARPRARLGADQVAHPADAGRVEAVGRLVEDEHVRIAQQRGGDREALAHAHRVALHAPIGGVASGPTWSSTSSTRDSGWPPAAASTRRWLRPLRPGWKLASSSTAPTWPLGCGSSS